MLANDVADHVLGERALDVGVTGHDAGRVLALAVQLEVAVAAAPWAAAEETDAADALGRAATPRSVTAATPAAGSMRVPDAGRALQSFQRILDPGSEPAWREHLGHGA